MNRQAIIVGVASILMLTSGAFALTDVGDPIDIASWGQRFIESGVGAFDHFQLKFIDPIPGSAGFRGPGIGNFSQSGWDSTISANGEFIVADGTPSQSYMQFDLYFEGAKATPLTFYFQAWLEDTKLEEAKAYWSGGGWSFTLSTEWNAPPMTQASIVMTEAAVPIPEPFTMVTAFLAIGSFGMYVRKHSRKHAGR